MVGPSPLRQAFNQPFKTGPLIDQNGSKPFSNLLMNQTRFKQHRRNKRLFTRMSGRPAKPGHCRFSFRRQCLRTISRWPQQGRSIARRMLKVSWKILDPVADKDLAGTIHTATALITRPRR